MATGKWRRAGSAAAELQWGGGAAGASRGGARPAACGRDLRPGHETSSCLGARCLGSPPAPRPPFGQRMAPAPGLAALPPAARTKRRTRRCPGAGPARPRGAERGAGAPKASPLAPASAAPPPAAGRAEAEEARDSLPAEPAGAARGAGRIPARGGPRLRPEDGSSPRCGHPRLPALNPGVPGT